MGPLPDPTFWNEKRVFVTGHSGFIGGWLSFWLLELGAEVTGYALAPPTEPNFFDLTKLGSRLSDIRGDVRDREALLAAVASANPEFMLHLAAQPLVRAAYRDPLETLSSNVMGTANLLDVLRDQESVQAAVIFTSDKVYRDRIDDRAHREEDNLGGNEPYAASKAACELVTEAFFKSYFRAKQSTGPGLATVRAGNIIGGGDWAEERLVPDAIRAFQAGQPLVLRHPEAVRPWQHVLDPVRGLLLLCESLAGDPGQGLQAVNLGPSEDGNITVKSLAQQAAEAWGADACIEVSPDSTIPETGFLALDSVKAARALQWQTVWGLAKTIGETVAWYRGALRGEDAAALTSRQLAAYCADVRADPAGTS